MTSEINSVKSSLFDHAMRQMNLFITQNNSLADCGDRFCALNMYHLFIVYVCECVLLVTLSIPEFFCLDLHPDYIDCDNPLTNEL